MWGGCKYLPRHTRTVALVKPPVQTTDVSGKAQAARAAVL